MKKKEQLWTYCYSISNEANGFVKMIYENVKINVTKEKKIIVKYLKSQKKAGNKKLNILKISEDTKIPIYKVDAVCDELVNEGFLTEVN